MPTPLANKEHLVMMTSPPASQPKRTSPLRPFGSGPSGNLKPSCTRPWRERRSGRMAVGQSMGLEYTPESTHIDPRRMAPLKECVPLPTDVVFRVHGIVFQGVVGRVTWICCPGTWTKSQVFPRSGILTRKNAPHRIRKTKGDPPSPGPVARWISVARAESRAGAGGHPNDHLASSSPIGVSRSPLTSVHPDSKLDSRVESTSMRV